MRYLNRWNNSLFDPFRVFDEIDNDLFALTSSAQSRVPATYSPACDISDREGHYLVSIDMPGIAKKDIEIHLKDGALHVKGTRKVEHKNGDYRERRYGHFERVISLPDNLQESEIQARYGDGVLYVAVPKKKETKEQPIPIGDIHEEKEEQGLWQKLLSFGKDKDKKTKEITVESKEGRAV